MPKISLAVCLYRERDFLERLLSEMAGRFDDLVVVHDGPEQNEDGGQPSPPARPIDYAGLPYDAPLPPPYRQITGMPQSGSIHELVVKHHGRFFEGPRSFQQEPHWPFVWWQARHEWILRLDADEFPSAELRAWLAQFRQLATEPAVSGYVCIWPMWNGKRQVTERWPAGRNFLFHRERVSFFGMVEQVPEPDNRWEALPLTLRHEPRRKSYGLRNVLWRRQGSHWRRVIAESLLHEPSDLPRWRWGDKPWPHFWQRLRDHPLRAGSYFLLRNTAGALIDLWRTERKLMPAMALATPLHHFLLALSLWRMRHSARTTTKCASLF